MHICLYRINKVFSYKTLQCLFAARKLGRNFYVDIKWKRVIWLRRIREPYWNGIKYRDILSVMFCGYKIRESFYKIYCSPVTCGATR